MPKSSKSAEELERLMRAEVPVWPLGTKVTIYPYAHGWRASFHFSHPQEIQYRDELNAIALRLRERYALKNWH